MRNNLCIALFGLFLVLSAGCANKGLDGERNTVSNANFTQNNGKVTLTFNSKGEWLSISSTALSAVSANTAEGREQAVTVATLRSRRNIAEFMSSELKSTRSVVVVSRTLEKASETNSTQGNSQPVALTDQEMLKLDSDLKNNSEQLSKTDNNFTVANTVREQITQSSSAILKGLVTVQQEFSPDSKSVKVEVRADKSNIDVANKIRLDMSK